MILTHDATGKIESVDTATCWTRVVNWLILKLANGRPIMLNVSIIPNETPPGGYLGQFHDGDWLVRNCGLPYSLKYTYNYYKNY
jgi:hypothetical protein